jgi:hypothetical protein
MENKNDSIEVEACPVPICSVFEIRTLRDIFELPTFEQMETCLDELATSMKLARATAELIAGMVRSKTGECVEKVFIWPDVVEWVDDGKGEVGAEFRSRNETIFEVTSRLNTKIEDR